ncbi:hypothetical protein [Phyllobacterium sp. P5_D12]
MDIMNDSSCKLFIRLRQVSTARAPRNPASPAKTAGFSITNKGWFGDLAQRQNSVWPAGFPFDCISIACIAMGNVRGIVLPRLLVSRSQMNTGAKLGKWISINRCARWELIIELCHLSFVTTQLRLTKRRQSDHWLRALGARVTFLRLGVRYHF